VQKTRYTPFTAALLLLITVPFLGCSKKNPTSTSGGLGGGGGGGTGITITIDSKASSLMIDQVSEAKHASLMTGHSYRVSLSSNATPIGDRVCIMYQSQERGLTFDVLTTSLPITFTAGYDPFYTWLTDWSTRSDNTGSATVTIKDLTNNTQQTLTIDSKNESLMVDQQPECKFATLTTGKSYKVTLSSNATPIGDRVFIMYQSQERGLTFDALTTSSPISFTAAYSNFCAYLTDWSTRADNTGSATVTITPQ
jgi:hypothetical protein